MPIELPNGDSSSALESNISSHAFIPVVAVAQRQQIPAAHCGELQSGVPIASRLLTLSAKIASKPDRVTCRRVMCSLGDHVKALAGDLLSR